MDGLSGEKLITCADCATDLDSVPAGQPCPSCGGTRRNAHIFGQAAVAIGVAISATVSIGHPKQGSWQQKWMDIEWQLAELREMHRADSISNVALRIKVENVLKCCRELADWLWEHPTETALTKKRLLDFVQHHPELRVCDSLAQTSKHNVRSQGKDPVTAWVVEVADDRATIEWENESGTIAGQRDALELCEAVADAWLTFLKGEGLLEADHKPIRV